MNSDNSLVTDAILGLPRDVIAGHAAMLENVNLFSLLRDRVNSVVEKSAQDTMSRKLQTSANLLASTLSDADLAFRLIAELSQTLDISPRHFVSMRDFDDVADDLVNASVTALRKAEKTFSGSTLQDLVQFTVESMFGEVGRRFDNLDSDKQADVLNSVRTFIAQLPHEQQEEVREKLGLNELSDDYLRRALVTGGLASAFASAVSMGGFAFYTGAVSLLATMAGLVGLTIPFAIYTSLTSAIAVGANPVFVLPVLGVGGIFLYRSQNSALRRRFAVNAIVQLALAGSSLGDKTVVAQKRQQAINAWSAAADLLRQAQERCDLAVEEFDKATQSLRATESSLHQTRLLAISTVRERDQSLEALGNELETLCEQMASGSWGVNMKKIGVSLAAAVAAEKAVSERALPSDTFQKFFGRLEKFLDKTSASKALRDAKALAVDEMIKHSNADLSRLPGSLSSLHSAVAAENHKLSTNALFITSLSSELNTKRRVSEKADATLADRKSDLKKASSRYWGLA